MMETTVEKKKILLVGGMDYNIPSELKETFDVVRHITHGTKLQSLPSVDYIFVATEWASHKLVEAVKSLSTSDVVPLPRGGWAAIRMELEKRSILLPEGKTPIPKAPVQAPRLEESLFSSMSESEVWKKYGASIIDAAQQTLKPKEVVSEDDALEALSLSGVPKEDCRAFLPKLQMKGILDPVKEGKWRLMAAPGVDFDNDRADLEASANPEVGRPLGDGRRQVRSPALIGMIAGLSRGPYASKRALVDEMRRYIEFDSLSDWQVGKYIGRAISQKIVDDSMEKIFVNQNNEIHLTLKKEPISEPKAPDQMMREALKGTPLFEMPLPTAKRGLDQTEAEKAWCWVVETVKKERDRLGNVLAHCRIEWMGTNNVLVIFLPAVLAQWQKFMESTENWGVISKSVQEKFSKGTAIRFMLDNGHKV